MTEATAELTAASEARLSEIRARMNDWKPRCAVEGCATRAASFLGKQRELFLETF